MFYSKLKHTDWSPWWCTLWAYRCHNVRVVSVLHSSCVVNDNWSMTIYWTRQSGPASQLVQTSPLNLGSYQTYSYVAVPVKITLITSASYHSHSDRISFVSLALWSHQLRITLRLAAGYVYRDEDEGFRCRKFTKPWPTYLESRFNNITMAIVSRLQVQLPICNLYGLLLWYNHLVAMVSKSNHATTSVTNYPCSALASGHRQLFGSLQ